MSATILAQQLRVGDKIDRNRSELDEVVSVTPSGRRVIVVIVQTLKYRPNEPVTVYRDTPKGEPS